jgi:hypothetical protein
MDLAIIKDWLIPVSTFITLMTASISGCLALKEYRLKAQAETRLTKSAEIESDIKLIQIFIEIMDIAHARRSSEISEKAIEAILSSEEIKKLDLSKQESLKIFHESLPYATITLSVGYAAQDAAICAIWALGKEHHILKQIAIQALSSLQTMKPLVVDNYLQDLKSENNGKK